MVITDSSDAYEIQYNMLKITAGWPQEDSSCFYRLRSILSFVITAGLAVTLLIDLSSKLDNFSAMSEVLFIFINIVTYNVKYVNYFVQQKGVLRIVELTKHSLFVSYPEEFDYLMLNRVNFIRSLTKLYRSSSIACITLMFISPIFGKQSTPFPFPYDLGKYTPMLYCFQVISMIFVAWNNVCYDSITGAFMSIAISHLEILSECITQLANNFRNGEQEAGEETELLIKNNVKTYVKYHMVIIEFTQCIEQVLSTSTFAQFLGSAVAICNTIFYLTLVPIGSSNFFMLIIYLSLNFVELFMYCWFGNEILWKSTNICEACYSSIWYRCDKSIIKYIFLIMERSRRPLKITAGKVSVLSLSVYVTIIQWSYSYFALLMKMTSKQSEKNEQVPKQ